MMIARWIGSREVMLLRFADGRSFTLRDLLRPADNLGFVKSALNANPKPEIDFVIVRPAA